MLAWRVFKHSQPSLNVRTKPRPTDLHGHCTSFAANFKDDNQDCHNRIHHRLYREGKVEASTSAASYGRKRGELKAEFLRMTADVVLFSVPYKLQSTC